MDADPRVSVVVLTHNRCDELLANLQRLAELPERPPLIVVDNASTDDTVQRVQQRFPQVTLVRLPRNRGAAGRNAGIERATTPYVACCDDDCWWSPGALERAADLLDLYPKLGAVAARVLVGPEEREDPTCTAMARSALDARGLPGPALIGFMAGAVVLRRRAFVDAGGYEPRLFLGAEERLLGLDMLATGWRIAYARDVTAHHDPSPQREEGLTRQRRVRRNTAWIAWLRLPWGSAVHETWRLWREAAAAGEAGRWLADVLPGLGWALAERRVLPPEVERARREVLGVPWAPPRLRWRGRQRSA